MKRTIAMLLALVMVLSMSVMAFADETEAQTGSITINGASKENIYEIYKIMNLESYDKTSGAYSYKAAEDWEAFFATEDVKQYVTTDDAGYITWTAGDDADTVAAFAKLALAWAKVEENNVEPLKSTHNEGDYTYITDEASGKDLLKFADLSLGYYLVDSTMGALCGLTTTNPDASINAKNGMPVLDKQVYEDSTKQWGKTNSADIGQEVQFRVTINVHAGAENYILHDQMGEGFEFDAVLDVTHTIPNNKEDSHTVDEDLYTVVTEDLDDDCDFHIIFSQEVCDELETNDKLVITYQGILMDNAVIAGNGNPNTAWLEFGEGHTTAESSTHTFTYAFDLVKTDSQNQLLDNAGFRIYDAANGGNEIGVVWDEDKGVYRRAMDGEENITVIVYAGNVRVEGFDNGTYYLEEVQTPAGYNQLTSRQKFIIADSNLDATFNNGVFSTGSGVHVVNKTGSMLPETGGIGTVLFVTIGTVLAIGTGVLLVTKKRMSMIED